MESMHYITAVTSDHDIDGMPQCARFTISEALARKIVHLATVAISNGLYKVELFDCTADFLDEEPEESDENGTDVTLSDTESETLNVSGNEFWFAGFLKHSDLEFNTERQRIKDLALHFGIRFDPNPNLNPNPTPEPATLEVKNPYTLFVERVADLHIWDHDQENGDPYEELDEPPSDGYLDSHTCLMNLIETARKIDEGVRA